MSVVTNIILTCNIDDTGPIKLSALMPCGIVKVNHYAGGPKAIEADVYMGAYNYLHLPEFLEDVKKSDFDFPENLRIFVKEQEDEYFRELNHNA